MIDLNKDKIKEAIEIEQIYNLIDEWGGEPQYTSFGIISRTICHNPAYTGSHKLYIYANTKLCRCYTGCPEPTFDIFELVCKVMKIQHNIDFELNDAVHYIAKKIGYTGEELGKDENGDWEVFKKYERAENLEPKDYHIQLPTYDKKILNMFNYSAILAPWEKEGISRDVIKKAQIGFFPLTDQITIPHFDANNNLVGLRGRFMCKEDCERWGKYLPIKIGDNTYSHPTGMNLYGINWAKENIAKTKKVIVFEAEKSVLKFASYYGWRNNIAVGCNGSNISRYHLQQILDAGAQEMVIALDRQFQKLGDEEFVHLTNNLKRLNDKYKNDILVSIVFDKKMITGYKDAPIDCGPEIFQKLYKERIYLDEATK